MVWNSLGDKLVTLSGFKCPRLIWVSNLFAWKHQVGLVLLASSSDHLKIFLVRRLSSIVARRNQSLSIWNWCLHQTGIHPESPSSRSTGQFLPTHKICLMCCPIQMCTCLNASYHSQRPYIHIARYTKVLCIIFKRVRLNSEGNRYYPAVNVYIHRCIASLICVAIHNVCTTTNIEGSNICTWGECSWIATPWHCLNIQQSGSSCCNEDKQCMLLMSCIYQNKAERWNNGVTSIQNRLHNLVVIWQLEHDNDQVAKSWTTKQWFI